MRHFVLLLCLIAPIAVGQSSAPSSASKTRHRAMPGGERSVKGCISQSSSGDYFLVPQRGAKVLLAASSDVKAHANQQVKLNGAFIDAERTEAPGAGNAGNKDENKHVVREFRVVKIDVLNASCPAGRKK